MPLGSGGGQAVLLPMAIATLVEETAGVRRYQALQTASNALTIGREQSGDGAQRGVAAGPRESEKAARRPISQNCHGSRFSWCTDEPRE
jgi:hypothetical protein